MTEMGVFKFGTRLEIELFLACYSNSILSYAGLLKSIHVSSSLLEDITEGQFSTELYVYILTELYFGMRAVIRYIWILYRASSRIRVLFSDG